jgi:ketosteroid isomerase-like protein
MGKANRSVVQRAYKSFREGDIDGVLDTLADDVRWCVVAPPDVFPAFGARQGQQGVADYFRLFAETLELRDFSPRRYIAQGDTVMVLGRSEAVVRENGRLLRTDWVHVFTVRGGRIHAYQEFVDNAEGIGSPLAA